MAKEAMKGEELDSLIEAFNKTDVNGDGQIDSHDLVTLFRRIGMPINAENAKNIVSDFSDGKEVLSFSDFSAAAMHIRSQADEFRMLDAFDLFDHNKDGFIDYEELVQGLHSVGMEMTDGVKGIMKDMDTDGDGLISMGEFSVFWDQVVRRGDSSTLTALNSGSAYKKSHGSDPEVQFLPLDDLVQVTSIGCNFV